MQITPSNENAFGVALLAGRVVGTVQGSTGHVTVRAQCKAKVGASWRTVPFEEASHVFFDVPSPDGEFADKIGTYYPPSAPKWANQFFVDKAQTDEKRIAACKYLIATITGEKDGKHVLKSERCARCSKELTHPDSIYAMFGPECVKKVAPYMKNDSGTDAGAHEKKKHDSNVCAEHGWTGSNFGGSGDEKKIVDVSAPCPACESLNDGDPGPPKRAQDFVPPKPSVQRAPEPPAVPVTAPATRAQIVAVLKLGDKPAEILRNL